ncbi:InlB B-repeat-containing protein [Bifidobacterium callitrichidarum]|uniref:Cell wall-binding protein n=1 Tax=Bifidobacterium callitrichidarum TaxID=2052941 RepID=A0A2U2NC17_9BIFI|nr:InlB B-repeat-containing protein [Bifidobacterium callitrichidarum]PWG66691.1 hypothetical protein DF196_01955 [Bifidobacterium callitrichidarum]
MVGSFKKMLLSSTAIAMISAAAIVPSAAMATSAGTNITFIGSSDCKGGHGVMCAVSKGPDTLIPGAKFTYPSEMDKVTYSDKGTFTIPDTYKGEKVQSVSIKGYINYGDITAKPGAVLQYWFNRFYYASGLGTEASKYTTYVEISCQSGQSKDVCSGESVYADSVGGDDSAENWSLSNTIAFTQNVTLGGEYASYQHNFYRNYDSSDTTIVGTDSNMDDVIDAPDTPTRDGFVFDGWYTDRTGGIKVGDGDKASSYSGLNPETSFYAHWKEAAKTWKVTFYTTGGSSVPSQTVEDEKTATKPSDPTKEGKTFAGWYTDAKLTEAYDFSTPVTSDLQLYAKWNTAAPTQYTVSFVTYSDSKVDSVKVDAGQKLTKPTDPAQDGYKFVGWYTDDKYSTPYDFDQPVTKNLTLYAKWEEDAAAPMMHAVTFDTNGGETSIPAQNVEEGKTVSKPADPIRKGYKFTGWSTSKTGGTAYDFSSPVTKDLTLYATWSKSDDGGDGGDGGDETPAKTHAVVFETNGGSTIASVKIDDGQKLIAPDDPSKTGFKFAGWYTDKTLTASYDFSQPVTADLTLYAKWESDDSTPDPDKPTIFQVSFETNVGNKIDPISVESGKTLTVPIPERSGYKFAGWYTDTKLTDVFDSKTPISKNMTLYAKWEKQDDSDSGTKPDKPEAIKYTITFDDGSGNVTTQNVEEGKTPTRPKDPSRKDSTFAGWYSDSEFSIPFDFTKPVEGDTTVYAKWIQKPDKSASTHKISFDTNGGSKIDPIEVQEGTPIKKPSDPSRDGFTFGGWYADQSLATPFDFSTTVTSDMILYAKWNSTKHTVTFDPNNGNPVQTIEVENGHLAQMPGTPLRDNYTFAGWYTDKALTQKFDVNTRITGDLHLYAKWTPTPAEAAKLAATGVGIGLGSIGALILLSCGVLAFITRRTALNR